MLTDDERRTMVLLDRVSADCDTPRNAWVSLENIAFMRPTEDGEGWRLVPEGRAELDRLRAKSKESEVVDE